MVLTIDIGNTRTKLVVFNGNDPVECVACPTLPNPQHGMREEGELFASTARMIRQYAPQMAIWCNTGQVPDGYLDTLHNLCTHVVHFTASLPTALDLAYHTPETLGADRLAAALGAYSMTPETDLLVIDVGTCITYDRVDRNHRFVGGNISPGLRLRFQALHDHTAALPLVRPDGSLPDVGYDTETAIRCGVVHGLQAEIREVVRSFQTRYPSIQVWMTGGDTLRQDSGPHDSLPEDTKKSADMEWASFPHRSDSFLVARGLNQVALQHLKDA